MKSFQISEVGLIIKEKVLEPFWNSACQTVLFLCKNFFSLIAIPEYKFQHLKIYQKLLIDVIKR